MEKPFKINTLFHLLNVLLLAYLTIMVFSAVGTLPDKIPTHFDLAGHPDNYGSRNTLYFLLLVPWGISMLGYLFLFTLPFWKKNPHFVASPGMKKICQMALEKQAPYWAVLKEFMAGLLVCLNVIFYIIVKQTILIARQHMEGLNTIHIWLALALMLALIVYYMVHLNQTTKRIISEKK